MVRTSAPRLRFQSKDAFSKQHLDVTATESFMAASEFALLQLVAELPDTADPVAASAGYQRVIGARRYMELISTLADIQKPPVSKSDTSNLNHRA